MNVSQFNDLQSWFESYVTPFCDTDPEGLRNIRLKIEHTRRVCDIMRLLVVGEGLSADEGLIAASCALLHDVGRFPQYQRWRTFRDSESDNHARLSVEVVREHRLLETLPPDEALQIEEAVRFHNLLNVPQNMKSATTLFLRLIRDADKLDIWHVFLDYFRTPEQERPSATMLGLPHRPGVTSACLEQLSKGQVVHLETVNCINDFKLLLISWIYDLNFSSSYRLAHEYRYLSELAVLLPDQEAIKAAVQRAREHCTQQMTGISS